MLGLQILFQPFCLQVTFVFNDKPVDPASNWHYQILELPGENEMEVKYVLQVHEATLDDAGEYQCYTSPDTSASMAISVWSQSWQCHIFFSFISIYIKQLDLFIFSFVLIESQDLNI